MLSYGAMVTAIRFLRILISAVTSCLTVCLTLQVSMCHVVLCVAGLIWLDGMMLLVILSQALTFGTEYGAKQDVLLLEFFLK